MIDGKIVFRKPIGGPEESGACTIARRLRGARKSWSAFTKIPVQVEAGVRDVVVAFIDRSHVESDENIANPVAFDGLTGSLRCAPTGGWPVWSTALRSPDRITPRVFRELPAAT